ncbi:MAG TPA: STAS domain-containing protein, partial [Candidatus Tumulicola sp.]|nr:STAS domain-containing protein [Candidatus Tumulicola sp.]
TTGWQLSLSLKAAAKMDNPEIFIVTIDRPELDIFFKDDFANRLERTYGRGNVVVDMSSVRFIDSTCLGKLAAMRRERARRDLPQEKLVISSPQMRRIFEIVRFDTVWPIYDTLEEALETELQLL